MPSHNAFFSQLPLEEQPLANLLRQLVLEAAPDFEERISYGVPYYFRRTRICFIWPASAKFGPPTGITFGFCRGKMMSNSHGMLNGENRKEIATILFNNVKEVNVQVLREMLQEAILLDEEMKGKKK